MFGRLFKKKHTGTKVTCRIACRSVDYYRVIEPSAIREMKAPEFNMSQWSSEEEYRAYLESVQPLIDEYASTGTIHTIEYQTMEDVAKYRDEAMFLNNFKASFLNFGSHVNVRKCLDGTYEVSSNGRHRMYVARKYGLKLLVHVSDEEYAVWE